MRKKDVEGYERTSTAGDSPGVTLWHYACCGQVPTEGQYHCPLCHSLYTVMSSHACPSGGQRAYEAYGTYLLARDWQGIWPHWAELTPLMHAAWEHAAQAGR